jgi:hypothetical protein
MTVAIVVKVKAKRSHPLKKETFENALLLLFLPKGRETRCKYYLPSTTLPFDSTKLCHLQLTMQDTLHKLLKIKKRLLGRFSQ